MAKTIATAINGRIETGEVIKENAKTVIVKFKNLPKREGHFPTLKIRKNKCKLLFGDTWEGGEK